MKKALHGNSCCAFKDFKKAYHTFFDESHANIDENDRRHPDHISLSTEVRLENGISHVVINIRSFHEDKSDLRYRCFAGFSLCKEIVITRIATQRTVFLRGNNN